MYIDKKVERGYNSYVSIEKDNGAGSMMDVGLLVMEAGDKYCFHESEKELAWILLSGDIVLQWNYIEERIYRADPFTCSTWCLHLSAGDECTITASSHSELYVQKTLNSSHFQSKLHRPEDTDTWHRGIDGECDGCIRRDVRTSFDYEIEPLSNMVLGETINMPGKWSSYPPHYHPQPEVYFYYYEKPEGFGAGWTNNEIYETHHHGLLVITSGTHPQVAAPGYGCCIVWGIRHLPGDPWKKTRIDDPVHEWLYDSNAEFWKG